MKSYRYYEVSLFECPVLFVCCRRDGPVGYIREVTIFGLTNKVGKRWKIFATWLGHCIDDDRLFRSRKGAADALRDEGDN